MPVPETSCQPRSVEWQRGQTGNGGCQRLPQWWQRWMTSLPLPALSQYGLVRSVAAGMIAIAPRSSRYRARIMALPAGAPTRASSASATWLHAVPRSCLTASRTPFMPCR